MRSSLSLDESSLSSMSEDSRAAMVLLRACLSVAISFLELWPLYPLHMWQNFLLVL